MMSTAMALLNVTGNLMSTFRNGHDIGPRMLLRKIYLWPLTCTLDITVHDVAPVSRFRLLFRSSPAFRCTSKHHMQHCMHAHMCAPHPLVIHPPLSIEAHTCTGSILTGGCMCRWLAIAPHLPRWCGWLRDWAFVVQPPQAAPACLSKSTSMGSVTGAHAGLGLGWLESVLDFGSWAVYCPTTSPCTLNHVCDTVHGCTQSRCPVLLDADQRYWAKAGVFTAHECLKFHRC